MSLLIDGYNLLHASGILPRGSGPSTLPRAREALLNYLVAVLPPEELTQTTIVFDAADAPPGLPDVYTQRGLTIRFAREHATADDLLEVLIRNDSAPRKLTVVSSDHQVQRAARRRRANTVDSDLWHADIRRRRRDEGAASETEIKPIAPLNEAEVQHWLEEFGDVDISQPASKIPPASESNGAERAARTKTIDECDLSNPFPPGYGEDLLSDEESP